MAKVTGGAFDGRELPRKYEQFADDTETQVVHLRLHRKRLAELQRLWRLKGQSMTTGARTILYEWLAQQMREGR